MQNIFFDRTIGFVGIGAAIPKDGNSFVSCLPLPQQLIIPLIMKFAGTKPPKSAIENGLCNNLHSLQAENVVNKFTSESIRLYTDKSKTNIPHTKKLYIELTNDREFSVSVQKKMARNLNCENIVTLESGHLPMLSIPEKLAAVLNQFIKSCVEQNVNKH